MQLLITICARGGSKGIPGKNIKFLNKMPLIGYSIETAFKFAKEVGNTDIALSSDDEQIITTAAKFGLVTDYIRPDYLATDQAGKIDTLKDILLFQEDQKKKKYDLILDLDVTSPLRTLEDLKQGMKIVTDDLNCNNLFSVSHPERNPYFNMVEKKDNGYYGLVKEGSFFTRQSAPEVYSVNASFYFYKRHFFDSYKSAVTDKTLIYLMPHICFDLDSNLDFEFLDFLLRENKLDFKL